MCNDYKCMKRNKSAFALAGDWKRWVILNLISHESVRPRTMTFTQAVKMMDLMSQATFVGQSSTIEKGTVTKARLDRGCVRMKGCSGYMNPYKQGDTPKLLRHVSRS
jgi:hypothetical protein